MEDQAGQGRRAELGDLQQADYCASDAVALEFTLQIANWHLITDAFGAGACAHARAHLLSLLHELAAARGLVNFNDDWIVAEGNSLDVRLPLAGSRRQGDHLDELPAALCSAAALRPYPYLGHFIHIALSYHPVRARRVASEPGSGAVAFVHDAAAPQICELPTAIQSLPDDPDARRCRADMAEASKLLAMVAADQLELAWQAVCATSDLWEVLYYEALLRVAGQDPGGAAPTDAIEALERLGLVRVLDAHVVAKVLDQLEADPSIFLGVNISARSATLDHWWMEIERRLCARRDLARRLVIEITETAEISPSHATAFADHMRRLGCRIALDDFGVGFASIRRLLALSPDIVKIDSLFVRRAPLSGRDGQVFAHIVGLARAIAPLVVVEGVETDDQCKLTEDAGATWFQGYRSGGATMVRPWVRQPDSHKMLALLRFRDAAAARSAEGAVS